MKNIDGLTKKEQDRKRAEAITCRSKVILLCSFCSEPSASVEFPQNIVFIQHAPHLLLSLNINGLLRKEVASLSLRGF